MVLEDLIGSCALLKRYAGLNYTSGIIFDNILKKEV